MLKKIPAFIFIISTILLSCTLAHAGKPVIFFSDLDSGPSSGNTDISGGLRSGEHGAIVTIWGKNLGSTQADGSNVIIGGQSSPHIYYWGNSLAPNKTGENYKSLYNSHKMQKISFVVHKSSNNSGIYVVTQEGQSNVIPFTIRNGNIYYVDPRAGSGGDGSYLAPWNSPTSYLNKLSSGEDGATCYFREGIYSNTEYGRESSINKSLFYINDYSAGIAGSPNAFIGYPNEVASFEATAGNDKKDSDYFMSVFKVYPYNSAQYLTISGLRLEANTVVANTQGNWRFVGNLCIGGNIFNSGTGILITGSHPSHVDYPERYKENQLIAGNIITGERSSEKLNHAVYFGASKNTDFGWNYIYDNDIDEGPVLSSNTEDSKEKGYSPLASLNIHDNVIDMSDFPSRAIGTHELAEGSDITIFNNSIIGPCYGNNPAIYFRSAAIKLFNNTLYNTGGNMTSPSISFEIRDPGTGVTYFPESIEIKNNIIVSNQIANSYIDIMTSPYMPEPTISNNLYYGLGPYSKDQFGGMATGGLNSLHNIDPKLEYDLSARSDSPSNESGTSSVSDVVNHDQNGFTLPYGQWHIGAFEYTNGSSTTAIQPPSQLFLK